MKKYDDQIIDLDFLLYLQNEFKKFKYFLETRFGFQTPKIDRRKNEFQEFTVHFYLQAYTNSCSVVFRNQKECSPG